MLSAGRTAEGLHALSLLETQHPADHRLQANVAAAYVHAGRHEAAQLCYRRAIDASPRETGYLFNLATSLMATGAFAEAEALTNHLLSLNSRDYEAWMLRSALRRQTPEDNHVEALQAELSRCDAAGEIQLCYALAKELEDLKRYAESFSYLSRGARGRRARLSYRAEGDVAAMRQIAAAYDGSFFAKREPSAVDSPRGPIFVTGLPRSGTTLVDRILSSHSLVSSLGEINDLALAVVRFAGAGDKLGLIERSTQIDFDALGREYIASARGYGVATPYFLDKTPLNFLYLGVIHMALPGARVLHLARHPLDACFGMYKTLFRMGYPFSYDFDDLAEYYGAYQRLMNHWREVLPPGSFLDVSYEQLVAEPEPMTRRLLEFCGLHFEAQCLEFHRNPAPVATASSVQVRRPINQDAVQRWRHYERELAPMREKLVSAGVAL